MRNKPCMGCRDRQLARSLQVYESSWNSECKFRDRRTSGHYGFLVFMEPNNIRKRPPVGQVDKEGTRAAKWSW